MGKIERFEDIEAWRKARELTRNIYQITSQGALAVDFVWRDQLRRSAISIMANIAEGFEREGDKEFRQFLSLAKGSVGELKAQIYAAMDAGLSGQDQFHHLLDLADEPSRLIAGFMRYLKESTHKGSKYK